MEEKDQTIMPTLTSDVRLKPMIEHSEILMETTTKKMGDMLKSMQEEIQNLESPQTIAYLIQRLQEKLNDLSATQRKFDPLKQFRLPDPTQIVTDNYLLAITNTTEKASLSKNGGFSSDDDVLLHSDTIILVSSMVVMIILGLILYKIMAYFTKLNNRRSMYQSGLKQLGHQMHIVTRTMSVEPPTCQTPDTPRRKRPLTDSPSTARVLQEARRGTIFKQPTNIMRRDEDFDSGVQTASQEAHYLKLEMNERARRLSPA